MNSFLRRIDSLSKVIKETCGNRIPPSFEQFCAAWETIDQLSQGLYLLQAECPGILGDPDEYDKVVSGDLERMGLVTEHYAIQDIWDEV